MKTLLRITLWLNILTVTVVGVVLLLFGSRLKAVELKSKEISEIRYQADTTQEELDKVTREVSEVANKVTTQEELTKSLIQEEVTRKITEETQTGDQSQPQGTPSGNYVQLSPGSSQSGSISITGTIYAGSISASGSLLTGVNADRLDNYHASSFAWSIHGHSQSDIASLPQDLAARLNLGGGTMVGNITWSGTQTFGNATIANLNELVGGGATTLHTHAGGGGGTVTSVGLSMPGQFTITGSPVTTTGTLTASWNNQSANTMLAAPDGAAGAPAFRSLVAGDIPSLDAAKITTGTFASARLSGAYSGITGIGTITTGVWNAGAVTSSGNINTTGGVLQTNSTTRIDNSGNLSNIGTTQINSQTYTWPGAQVANGFLQTNGTGTLSWTTTVSATSVPFSGITSATNTSAAMVVGTGASLGYSGSGTINASSLIGSTWAIPGAIGATTPSTGAFTTLSSSGGFTVSAAGASITGGINNNTGGITNTGAIAGATTITASGNMAIDTDTLFVDAAGEYVGIGTTGPAGKLDVRESGAKTAADYGLYLANTATSSTDSINKYGMYLSSTGIWNGASANNYGLYVDTPTGGTNNYAAVFAGGNVGIGTISPTRSLEVSGDTRISEAVITDRGQRLTNVVAGAAGYMVAYNGSKVGGSPYQIGLATSRDGYNFVKSALNPIISPVPATWESNHTKDPWLLKVRDTYYLYYTGFGSTGTNQIGLATSRDGITWTKHSSNPVVTFTDTNNIHRYLVVNYDSAETDATRRWKMWFVDENHDIGYAYSADGVTWTKYSGNPVLSRGAGGQWDSDSLGPGGVYRLGNTWYLPYGGRNAATASTAVGVATFTNPESSYTKSGSNPIVSPRSSAGASLTADLNSGNKVLTVADTSIFQANEYVWLYDDNSSEELNRIASIDSATQITLRDTVSSSFTVAQNALIRSIYYKSICPRSITLENGKFTIYGTSFQALNDKGKLLEQSVVYTSDNLTSGWSIDIDRGIIIPLGSGSDWDTISAENPVPVPAYDEHMLALTQRLAINASGNIGIGQTSPSYKLDILNSIIGQTASNRVFNVSNAGATFDTTAGALNSYGGYFSSTSTRSVGANNLTNIGVYATASGAQNNYAAIFENGNVGIGTTSPGAALEINGANDTTQLKITDDDAGPSTAVASITRPNNLTSPTAATAALFISDHSSNFPFHIQDHNANSLFTVKGNGNVGIGTASPGARLDVNPTVTTTSDYTGIKSGITYNGASAMTNWYGSYIAAPTGTGTITNKYALVTEADAGKVGIGTTSPLELLNISAAGDAIVRIDTGATSRAGQIKINRGGTNNTWIGLGSSNNFDIWTAENAPIRIANNNSEKIRIDTSGNVGIGTVSPSANLTVAQKTTAPGTVATNGTTTLTGTGTIFTNTFKVGDTITVSGETVRTIATIPGDTSLTVTVAFSTTASGLSYTLTGGTRLVVQGNGNVGIGTTNPIYKLEVNNTIGLTSGFGTTYDSTISQSMSSPYSILTLNSKAGTGAWRGAIDFNTNYNAGSTFTAMTIRANTDGTTANVGIGTTSPGTKLAVAGLTGTASYNYVRVNTATGDFYYDSSSARYKENIQTLSDDFSKILQLEPKSFTDKASGMNEIGLIAEDLNNLGLSNLVIYKDGLPDAIKYEKIPLYLLEVAKSQQLQIGGLGTGLGALELSSGATSGTVDALKTAIEELKTKEDADAAKIAELEGRVALLEAAPENSAPATGVLTADQENILAMFSLSADGKTLTVKGDLEVQGRILGSSQSRGKNIDVPQGRASYTVTFAKPRTSADYAVSITPSWMTQYAVTEKRGTGFIIEFSNPAPSGATIDWIVLD